MRMSDIIAECIAQMLSEGGGVAQLQRKSLADRFSCAPSQINYVIETRFTPENGYLVESQRGGGGYIRIVRVMEQKEQALVQAARAIEDRLSASAATRLVRALSGAGLLAPGEGQVLLAAASDHALAKVQPEYRDVLRAQIVQCGLLALAT